MATEDKHSPYSTVIRDTYTVDSFLGKGNFADVYKVRHRFMGMQAMKVLRDIRTVQEREQGLYEAFQLSRFSHPAIVRVFDGNCLEKIHGGFPYVTMELVDGGTLGDISKSSGKNFVRDVLDAAVQLASAIGHAHNQLPTILHRDIKPSNVLITRGEGNSLQLRLADFGLAVPINAITGFAVAAGTLAYRSPESLDGFEIPASDVYAYGLTMYESMTGVFPFLSVLQSKQENLAQTIAALKEAQAAAIEPPSYYRHAVHPAIDAIVMRCLAFEYQARITNGQALEIAVNAMRKAVEGDPMPSQDVKNALVVARDCKHTQQAVEALSKALRANPQAGLAYMPMLSFLQSEVIRLASGSSKL